MSAFVGRGAGRGRERRGISFPVEVEKLEPISPELVLVDPELRRLALARLDLVPTPDTLAPRAAVAPPLAAAAARPRVEPVASQPPPRRSGALRLAPVLVPAALVFGVVVAVAASEMRRQTPALVQLPPKQVTTTVAKPGHPPPLGSSEAARVAAERKVLAAAMEAPEQRLPKALIDPTTGLGRNNLQASCRRRAGSPDFRCVVRWAGAPRRSVSVRYRPTRDGRGAFTWSWSR